MQKLKQRWGIRSNFELVMIITVFAINGSLSARIGLLLMNYIGLTKELLPPFAYYLIAAVLILPIYPLLIMITGSLLGQRRFFIPFAKGMLRSLSFGLLFKSTKKRAG